MLATTMLSPGAPESKDCSGICDSYSKGVAYTFTVSGDPQEVSDDKVVEYKDVQGPGSLDPVLGAALAAPCSPTGRLSSQAPPSASSNGPSLTAGDVLSRPLPMQPEIHAAVEPDTLFERVQAFFKDAVPAEVLTSDQTKLASKAVVLHDYRPIYVSVWISPTEGGSKATFADMSRNDVVSFWHVYNLAKKALAPGEPGSNARRFELLPFEMDDDDFFDENKWLSEVQPGLLAWAASENMQERESAAVSMADHVDSSPTCRPLLAQALAKCPDVVENLIFRATFCSQYAAAATLAKVCCTAGLEVDVTVALLALVTRLLQAGLPAAVEKKLRVAEQGLSMM